MVEFLHSKPHSCACVWAFVFVVCWGSLTSRSIDYRYQVQIDAEQVVTNFTHFWKSTGFCPPLPHENGSWLLGKDMLQNLAFIGAVPHSGIQQVRVHWLLDAVTMKSANGLHMSINSTCLDTFLRILWENGLRPSFEVMGNPSGFFTDFENKTQIYLWRNLIKQLAQKYVDEYGLANVAKWNFESWNEPKKHHFGNLTVTLKGFLNYYDATAAGLRAVSPLLRLGAPGGKCKDYNPNSYCWGLLSHLQSSHNFYGHPHPKLDFISIHKKGDVLNATEAILKKEMDFYEQLQKNLPSLTDIPIFNDEGDPGVGWSHSKLWRADSTYAAMVVKVIAAHQAHYFTSKSRGPSPIFGLLSNDNGFLSYQPHVFSQRTLLARFQVNTTSPPHVQMVKKPVYAVMGLLSMLGEQLLNSTVTGPSGELLTSEVEPLGVLSTVHLPDPLQPQDSWQMAVLVYYSADMNPVTGTANLTVHISSLPDGQHGRDLRYVVYRLDNMRGNPYKVWLEAGSPPTPSYSVLQAMRNAEDPVRVAGPTLWQSTHSARFDWQVALPGLLLFHACARAAGPPDQITDLRFQNITYNQVLIIWSDSCVNSKCIKTYEIEFSHNGTEGYFQRINPSDTFFNTFVWAPRPTSQSSAVERVQGYYRGRAVDYWDRSGEHSVLAKYS